MINRYIKVKTSAEFIHQYTNAPDEVRFLSYPHRHMLQIEAIIEVFTDDRELEFILVKRTLNEILDGLRLTTVSDRSCEMIAQCILTKLRIKYGTNRNYQIEVSEDGENSAVLACSKEEN